MNSYRVGLIVPTLNAGKQWNDWIDSVERQSFQPHRKLVVDSSSNDGTKELAEQHGFEVLTIDKIDFNHGGTRDMAINYLSDCDILIFLTQDAILADEKSLENILSSFNDPLVAVTYGRQLPHLNAGPIGTHARLYNYSSISGIKTMADIPVYGFKTIFCSNSFSAYRRTDYVAIGGFKCDLIFGEDAHITGRLILGGKKVVYNATAMVYHSHDYSFREDARRYFDIGVFHTRDQWMTEKFGGASGEGMRFVRSEATYLLKNAWHLLPSAALRTFIKFGFYRLGRMEKKLPFKLKKLISMNRRYWR
jgi:rhamnosyltransferase